MVSIYLSSVHWLASCYIIVADIDECSDDIDTCDFNATCKNIPGNFTCMCNQGYSGDGFICEGNGGRSFMIIMTIVIMSNIRH